MSNACHSAFFYSNALGFEIIAYANSSTGLRGRVSYVLAQGRCRIILTSPNELSANNSVQRFLTKHGDGVRDICFFVKDINSLYSELKKKEVNFIEDINGASLQQFSVEAFGSVIHTFISYESSNFNDFLMLKKNYKKLNKKENNAGDFISHVDHIAFCGPIGFIKQISKYYCNVFDFIVSRKEDIESNMSGMKTIVLESDALQIKFPTVEPLNRITHSALENFLIHNRGAGVHHIAFYTNDLVQLVDKSTSKGVKYMKNSNKRYYDNLTKNSTTIDPSTINEMQIRNILCEDDQDGYLMQIFSEPTQPKPTFFFELIERKNNQGFGSNNIRALYDSIDRQK